MCSIKDKTEGSERDACEGIAKRARGACGTSQTEGERSVIRKRIVFTPLALTLVLTGAITLSACANSNVADEADTNQETPTTEAPATSTSVEAAETSEAAKTADASDIASADDATSDASDAVVVTRVYENEDFYVDAPEALTVSVTDDGEDMWRMNINAGDYGGGTHLIHVDSVSADEISANNKYAWVMGTTSSGRTVWVEELAGGGFISINGDGATRLSVFVGVK